jgi:hypothetical protein
VDQDLVLFVMFTLFFHLLVSSLSFDRGFGSELLVIFVLDQKVQIQQRIIYIKWLRRIQLEHKNDILTIY